MAIRSKGNSFVLDVTIENKRQRINFATQKEAELAEAKLNYATCTVVRYMAALSHAFTIGMREWMWVEDSPMRKVAKPREPRGRVCYLSDDERKRLLDACKESSHPYLQTIVVLALATGMRHGEIMRIEWDHVNFKDGSIILHETKNGERRRVPLTGFAKDSLKALCNCL